MSDRYLSPAEALRLAVDDPHEFIERWFTDNPLHWTLPFQTCAVEPGSKIDRRKRFLCLTQVAARFTYSEEVSPDVVERVSWIDDIQRVSADLPRTASELATWAVTEPERFLRVYASMVGAQRRMRRDEPVIFP